MTMRLSRTRWLGAALLILAPAVRAQQPDTLSGAAKDSIAQQVYDAQRAALVKQLQESQQELSAVRSQRIQLEANIDNALARAMQSRAQMLLMSPEQTALLQLDSTLAGAQDNMQAQRDRMQALGESVRNRVGAVLVVLLKTDSAYAGPVGGADLTVDGAAAGSHTYSAIAVDALHRGAVDQLYRAPVLPTGHTVSVKVAVGTESLTQSASVSVPSGVVTYIQFLVRGAQIVPSTWTSKGTTPF